MENLFVPDLRDPRSPATHFQRSPILWHLIPKEEDTDSTVAQDGSVEHNVSYVSTLASPMESDNSSTSDSFMSADDGDDCNMTRKDDPSAILSSTSFESNNTSSAVSEVVSKTEEIANKEVGSIVVHDENPKGVYTDITFGPEKVKLSTPERKDRIPLGKVCNIAPSTPPSRYAFNSPQFVLREKQWKRIQEERKKLGLQTDENMAPPYVDGCASAPGKLSTRKRKQNTINTLNSIKDTLN